MPDSNQMPPLTEEQRKDHMTLISKCLEVTAGLKVQVEMLDQRMTRHEQDCMHERRNATQQRQEFRQEMNDNLSTMKAEILEAVGTVKSDVKDKISEVKTDLQEDLTTVHGRVSGFKSMVWVATGSTILLLLGIVGYLITKLLGWE